MSFSVEAVFKATGISKFTESFKNAESSVNNFVNKNEKTFDSFRKVGTVATGAGLAVAGGLGYAVSRAADFEGKMSKVAAVSGATGKDFEMLSDKAREMGSKTSFSAGEAAEGLEYMALAGWDTQQMMSGLEPILHLAEAGSLDLGRASDLVTDSMAAMGLEVQDLEGYLDKVAATSSNANTDIDQLMEAFVIAGGTFDRFNVPLDEANAFLGILANRGTKGSEAGTALNAIMTRIGQSTGPAADALEEMGISAYDADGNFRGMEAVMKDIQVEMEGMTDKERAHYTEQLAGLNHGKSFTKMLQGLGDEYDELKGDVENSTGALEEMRNTMKDNLQGELENLSSAFDEMMISIGEALLPAVKALVTVLQALADWFNGLSDSTKSFIAISAAVISILLLIVGPILLLIGFIPQIIAGVTAIITVLKAIGAVIGVLAGVVSLPFILITAAVIAAAAIIYIYWEPIKEFFINLWESIKEIGISVWESLKEIWASVSEYFLELWEGTVEFFTELWSGVKEFFVELWENITETAVNVWDVISEAWNSAVEIIYELFEPLIEFFAQTWENITNNATEAWDGFTNMITTVWEGIKTIASNLWEMIKIVIITPILVLIQMLTGDFEGARDTLSQIWDRIKEIAKSTWDALKSIVSAIVKSLITSIQNAWSNAKSFLSGLWESIKSTAANLWEGMKTVLTSIVNSTKTAIQNKWNEIKTAVVTKATEIVTAAKEKFEAVKNAIRDKLTEAVSVVGQKIGEMPGKVMEFFGSMVDSGKMLISGLINGIKNMAGAAIDAITGVVDGVVGKAKSLLKIKSPSRVFQEMGAFTGEGLAKGMDSTKRLVEKASSRMASSTMFDVEPINIGSRVNSINKQAERQLNHTFESDINVNNKQPAYINLNLGGRDFEVFVDDISDVQSRKDLIRKSFA